MAVELLAVENCDIPRLLLLFPLNIDFIVSGTLLTEGANVGSMRFDSSYRIDLDSIVCCNVRGVFIDEVLTRNSKGATSKLLSLVRSIYFPKYS